MLRVCIYVTSVFLLLFSACGPVAPLTPDGATPAPTPIVPTPTASAAIAINPGPAAPTVTDSMSKHPTPTMAPVTVLPPARERPTSIPAPACLANAPSADAGGEFVTDIAAGGGRTFVAIYTSVLSRTILYVSDDVGQTWNNVRSFNDFVSVVVPSPDFARDRIVYAAGSSGVYRSLNGGSSWTSITPSTWVTTTPTLKQLAVSPNFNSDHTIVFATKVAPRGVFASTDSGASWIDWLVDAVDEVLFSPNYGVDHALWVARNDERTFRRDVLVTVNQGDQWDFVRARSLVPRALSPAYSQDSTVIWTDFAGGGIFVSRNGDRIFPAIEKAETEALNVWRATPPEGWTVVGENSVSDLVFSPDFARDRTAFALSDDLLLASRDSGESWQPLCYWNNGAARPGGPHFDHLAISPDFAGNKALFAGGSGARIAISRDGGRTWVAIPLQ
jgi:photosystem II stability/assembly factor-like uncharacterized protein